MSAAKKRSDEESDICRSLGHAPHQVGVPRRAVGDVDADSMADARELLLKLPSYAVQHLDLERALIQASPRGRLLGPFEQAVIVGCYRRVGTVVEQPLRQINVLSVHFFAFLECNLRG